MADEVATPRAEYRDRVEEWRLMRDSVRGETAIKREGTDYLPEPTGFILSESRDSLFRAYVARAEYPGIVILTKAGMTGVIVRKEIEVEMPTAMEGLWEKATPDGQPLEALFHTIVQELLEVGRYGLLADASTDGSDLPWIATYKAETIINWSKEQDFYVLDETAPMRFGFLWEDVRKYRVLELIDGQYIVTIWEDGEPQQKVVDGVMQDVVELEPAEPVSPIARGGKSLEEIPFALIGTMGLAVDPDDPPLLPVARAALAMYQLSADYRWQLFMTGQETLVIINADKPEAVGAGIVIELKSSDSTLTPEAKYVGISGVGLSAHREAINDKREEANSAGARLFKSSQASTTVPESGEARKVRYEAETATLVSIAQAAGAGLEKALRHIATMIGANPEEVVVTPDLSFIESQLTPIEAAKLMELWTGSAISYETFYENLVRGGIASTERDAEEERSLIDEEDIQMQPDPSEIGFLPANQPPPNNQPPGNQPPNNQPPIRQAA